MKKACGFTLIELILTLVLAGILAGIVVEIIAGPIRSYFWVTQQALKVENAEFAMSTIARDLQLALPLTVEIENNPDSQKMIFRKIRYEGLMVPSQNNDAKSYPILGKFGSDFDEKKNYTLFFPLENQTTFYNVQAKDTAKVSELLFLEALKNWKNMPVPFYLLSNPISFECNKNTHRLERMEDDNVALINNSISSCQFIALNDNQMKGVVVSIVLGSKGEKETRFSQPILFEKSS